jgi:hypothetical protein
MRKPHSLISRLTIVFSRMNTFALASIPSLIGMSLLVIGSTIQDNTSIDIFQGVFSFIFLSCPFIIFSIAGIICIIRQEFLIFVGKPAIVMGLAFVALCWVLALMFAK